MRAKKHLGQNWLVDARYADRIVDSVDPTREDLIVEIGPGPGALTDRIVPRAGHTLAIELDPRMRDPLVARHSPRELTVVEGDVLEIDLEREIRSCFEANPSLRRARVVANLPYYISTAVVARLIRVRRSIVDATLMLQREVVERLTAAPGGKEYGSLTVFVATYCNAVRLFDVPPGAFRPVPKVVSTVVQLVMLDAPAVAIADEDLYIRVVRASFAQRRKTLENNLAAAGWSGLAARAGIDPRRRAETLGLDEFARLAASASD